MNIEKLSPDKLRVTIGNAELDRYDLDYISISNESPGTRRMLGDILKAAQNSVGFSTKGCRLFVEVVPGRDDGCVLYVTRVAPAEKPRGIAPRAPVREGYILFCQTLEDTIGAVRRFRGYPDVLLRRSALYEMNGSYALSFNPVRFGMDDARFSALLLELSEFGRTAAASPVGEAMMAEHGRVIAHERAVEQFMRYFS